MEANERDVVFFAQPKSFDERASMLQFIAARETKAPPVGSVAPDFDLPLLGSSVRVRLSSFAGMRPVALVFGSYT